MRFCLRRPIKPFGSGCIYVIKIKAAPKLRRADRSEGRALPYASPVLFLLLIGKKVKLSLQQAVKAHRVVRRRGSQIFSKQSAHRWR
jgi:hypothetical protein